MIHKFRNSGNHEEKGNYPHGKASPTRWIYPARSLPLLRVVCLFLLLFPALFVSSQNSKFPVFFDQRLPRPEGIPMFRGEDFQVDLKRPDHYPEGFLYGNQDLLKKLGNYLVKDTEGKKLWEQEANNTAHILNQWDFNRSGFKWGYLWMFGTDRYIYRISQLENLSVVYLFTGNEILGKFIRAHLLQIAELPYEFWLHSELRGYNVQKPAGTLETSLLCKSVSLALSSVSEILTPSEKTGIEKALYEKGLKTCLNWLENPRLNNFTGVISGGAYVAARYFNDSGGMKKSLGVMALYLEKSIETDGSYGEGLGYFDFPIRYLLPAVILMDQDERQRIFASSGLRFSASWLVYPYLYASGPGVDPKTVVHFGDNSYSGPTTESVNLILGLLYNDPLASWLIEKFNGTFSFTEMLLLFTLDRKLPVPRSPEQSGLPLMKVFSSGDCFIRSTWDDNGIVLDMWSGSGSRVRYSHQRPELNSISLGAYGEYLVVSAGSASYRSSLRKIYDQSTRSANTITVDDENQLFKPARIIAQKSGVLADLLVSDAADAYRVPMKYVTRAVLFIKDPGYFVIRDRVESAEGLHRYSWRIHLNVKNDSGELRKIDPHHWFLSRPLADLDIYVDADCAIVTKTGEGYLHGPGRDYSPGGIFEGKLGSSVELESSNADKSASITFCSVLFPLKKGSKAPLVKITNSGVEVGKDKITFPQGKWLIRKGDVTEKFDM